MTEIRSLVIKCIDDGRGIADYWHDAETGHDRSVLQFLDERPARYRGRVHEAPARQMTLRIALDDEALQIRDGVGAWRALNRKSFESADVRGDIAAVCPKCGTRYRVSQLLAFAQSHHQWNSRSVFAPENARLSGRPSSML